MTTHETPECHPHSAPHQRTGGGAGMDCTPMPAPTFPKPGSPLARPTAHGGCPPTVLVRPFGGGC